ncbi:MAG: outer membrane beta-barrel protein [Lacibacter sp.]
MPKISFAGFFLFALLTSSALSAQKKAKSFIGGNLIYAVPSGMFKTGYKHGTGVDASLGVGTSKIYFVGTLGYLSYKAQSDNVYGKITVIPLKAGLRIRPTKSLFLAGNAGYGFLKDETMSSRDAKFMYDAGIGVHFILLDFGVYYDAWKKTNTPGYSGAVQLKFGMSL